MVTEKESEVKGGPEPDELDRLRQEKEDLSRELDLKRAAVTRLGQELAEKNGELDALKQALSGAEGKLADISDELARAVAAYREVVTGSNPGVLAELVTGDTIDEVDDSVKKARLLVDRVRREVEEETLKTRVPAGAPPRAPLDMSSLSPREKIQYAIGGA